MKHLIAAVAVTTILSTIPAFAQSVEFGPGGVRVDPRTQERRDRDERRAYPRQRAYERDLRTGTIRGERCRTVTVREEDEDGNLVRRRVRECR